MKLVARSVVGVLLLIPAAGLTQTPQSPPYARTGAGHDNDLATSAAARRRAVVRIVAGYEPTLAFLQERQAARGRCAETP